MSKQIEFFESDNIRDLVKDVNKFLQSRRGYNILNIKFNQTYMPKDDGWMRPIWYGVMIVYNDETVYETEEESE